MARQRVGSENIRKLTKVGQSSLCVTIPRAELRKLGWRERQRVTVVRRGKRLIIEDFVE